MRIACLQFAPQVGDVNNNLNRADSLLSRADPQDLDLLVLPELAFIGYNFRSLHHISPYLEHTTSGITSLWARTTALKYNCVTTAGYPEKVDLCSKWPASPEYYNSTIVVNANGETVANYRKSLLFTADETWAPEGPSGFYDGHIDGLRDVAMGICKWPRKPSDANMDLNPYKFEAAWNAWEFARHVLYRQANLIILSMAWMTREDGRSFRISKEPDTNTLSSWLARLEPIIGNEGEDEIIAVFANRAGAEDNAVYAETSTVLGIQAGEVKVYGILGREDRDLLVVNTSTLPKLPLVSEPRVRTPRAPIVDRGTAPVDDLDAISFGAVTKGQVPNTGSSMPSGSTSYSDNSSNGQFLNSTGKTSILSPRVATQIPISTGSTTLKTPQMDPCWFSPLSPVDNPLPQAYFAQKDITEATPDLRPAKESKTPTQADFTKSVERYPTPVPVLSVYTRPASPKSRSCSRSREVSLPNSPPINRTLFRMRNIISDEQRLQQDCAFLEAMGMTGLEFDVKSFDEEALDPNEIIYIEGEDIDPIESLVGNILRDARFKRAEFMAKHINNQQPASPPRAISIGQSDRRGSVNRPARSLSGSPPSQNPPGPNRTSPTETILVDRPRSRKHSRNRAPLHPRVFPKIQASVDAGNDNNSLKSAIRAKILASPTNYAGDVQHEARADKTIDRGKETSPTLSFNAVPFECSFTRNPLGPRSQHITPRPLSTVW
ncbi:unnamed protein product [Diplocarpon coronariae]